MIKINIKYLYIKICLLFFIIVGYIASSRLVNAQDFDIPEDFIDVPLIHSLQSKMKGIIKLIPADNNIFSKYSIIELSVIDQKNIESDIWLKDKLNGEKGNIAETERILRDIDSPFSDPLFESLKNSPMSIDDTLSQTLHNPFVFCQGPYQSFNYSGELRELFCIFPFGLFRKYIILRLQNIKNQWYFIKIESFNENRVRILLSIADSFWVGEKNEK